MEPTETVRELADALRARVDELAVEAIEALEERVPDYLRQLGFEGDDPLDISRAELDAIAGVLATTGNPLPRQTIRTAVDLGRRRAQQGVELEHLLEADGIHRELAVRFLETTINGSGGEVALMLAERRLDAHRDAAILALTRGYLAGQVEGFEQEHRELSALMSIMRAVSRSLEAGDIAEAAVVETSRAMRLQHGAVWLTPRDRSDSLVLLRTHGMSTEQIGALGQEIPIYGLLEEALVSDLPVQGNLDLPGAFGARWSVLAVALRGRADTVGLMALASEDEREFDAHAVAFIALVGEHVGVALANAEQLLREARTDHLTQLANRPEFDRAGQRTVATARRFLRPFTVMLLDLDNLKQFNDTHGHHLGDAAIQAVARALKSTMRATDVCARLGGDEFGVVMPEAGPDEAGEVSVRVRKALEEASTEGELPEPAEVSIGFATWDPTLDWRQVLRVADAQLYEDKRRRRVASVPPED